MLNEEQEKAINSILNWYNGSNVKEFLVVGPAGTGKTYLLNNLLKRFDEDERQSVAVTAPTNKAVKVLRTSIKDHSIHTCTVFSLLGLGVSSVEDRAECAKMREVNLDNLTLVVVDEASMVNEEVYAHLLEAAHEHQFQILYLGDPAQLPPPKETQSKVWKSDMPRAVLSKIVRHDNQILNFTTALRLKVDHPAPSIHISSNNDGDEGIFHLPSTKFLGEIRKWAKAGRFNDEMAKVIAWRNATVNRYNQEIREAIWENPDQFEDEELILAGSPLVNKEENIILRTDETARIKSCEIGYIGEYKVWNLILKNGEVLTPIHNDSVGDLILRLNELKEMRMWKEFWELKNSFHDVRYSYAITSHKSQGSTYENVFVDYKDILINRNRSEAFRCLYVAVTRAKKRVILA